MRVETQDGTVGWGEGTLEGHTEAIEGACQDIIRRFVGWDADRIQDIWQHCYRARFYRGGPVLMVRTFMFECSSLRMTDIVVCSIWTRHSVVGHQGQTTWSTRMAVVGRESP